METNPYGQIIGDDMNGGGENGLCDTDHGGEMNSFGIMDFKDRDHGGGKLLVVGFLFVKI
ncbi:hypothetical protein LV84_04152 [Algoriphagus ratkowskyi]|uniref:Uncharacterized protein n=1 Tax=Algoriphagus ratkowskyi TaxID=57028 RepID=A0A2W7SGV4_9BACT|nr:hypothetical protein [Algoriphagus ratkowskyi]PZX49962.1 hypothetical protein LV84_04152 [Algoriphagus ratkowskyi]TXD75531.1 hypothetical protein ESW18_20175 [Algoriphagus ratkowskyi]